MDSLDSVKESTSPAGRSAKPLIMSQNSGPTRRGGFQVDSPVRNPVASEIARSAPRIRIAPGRNHAGGGAAGFFRLLAAGSASFMQVAQFTVRVCVEHVFGAQASVGSSGRMTLAHHLTEREAREFIVSAA